MKKAYDKKVALKLINQYAEQYNRVADEKKRLMQEVTDLRSNIKVSKEIIESFYKTIPLKEKQDIYVLKTREEIALLTKTNNQLTKEINVLRNKTNYYEQIMNQSISDYRESTDSLQEKIFILENALIKKDNLIHLLNMKMTKIKEENDYSNDDDNDNPKNEIYIIDPTMSVNIIQDDLTLYKNAYENALQKLKDNNLTIERNEGRIEELRNEIVKLQSKSSDRNGGEGSESDKDKDNSHSKTHGNSSKEHKKTLANVTKLQTLKKEDITLLMQSEVGMKVMTTVNKCIEDKNKEIEQLKGDLKQMNIKNKILTEENMTLMQNLMDYNGKEQIRLALSNNQDNSNGNRNNNKGNKDSYADSYLNTNISMIGNTSAEEREKKKKSFITDKLNKFKRATSQLSLSMDDPPMPFEIC